MLQSEIARLLPGVFRQTLEPGSLLAGVLRAMDTLLTPAEQRYDSCDRAFDPRRATDDFVRLLARWVGMELRVKPPLGNLRELVAFGAHLARWRGTADGLRLFLELATGVAGFEVLGTDLEQPFHLKVRVPHAAQDYLRLVEAIVAREKPAYMTWELECIACAAEPTEP